MKPVTVRSSFCINLTNIRLQLRPCVCVYLDLWCHEMCLFREFSPTFLHFVILKWCYKFCCSQKPHILRPFREKHTYLFHLYTIVEANLMLSSPGQNMRTQKSVSPLIPSTTQIGSFHPIVTTYHSDDIENTSIYRSLLVDRPKTWNIYLKLVIKKMLHRSK